MAVLRRFHAHLAPGGKVILDIQPLASLAMRGANQRSWTAENGDLLTLDSQHTATDWLAQRIEYRIRYERWRDHKLVESELEPMAQRLWGLEEFRFALAAAGFGDIEVTGDYRTGRPGHPRANNLTFEATRV